jgi:eukaryotic-like serine/threonine-protein kinase
MPGDDLEQRANARVGRVLDEKYSLERLLGYGGMAAVYAARHRNGHRCAVKILHPEIARDEVVRKRFLSEGYAANKVEHPGAVEVTDDDVVRGGEDKGAAYLVMELLEGESVFTRARRSGTLSEPEVLAIAEGVLDVLDAAHSRGIVHRDLKPDNLFLVKQGAEERVKVLDFGIARIADTARKTNVGQTLGTPSIATRSMAAPTSSRSARRCSACSPAERSTRPMARPRSS